MKEGKEEKELPVVCPASRVDKASVFLENKEALAQTRRGGEAEGDAAQTVFTALPVHVQLFEGPVIQITSTSLVDTDGTGSDGERRETCEEKRVEGNCVMEGEDVATGGSVTLLTTDGKTYILPQPLTSEGGATTEYLIAEDVLSAEDVLQEEQMLTISPPPPSSLDFPPSDAQPPDPLAIATSEVFNDSYASLPLETQSQINGSRAFHLKTEYGSGASPSVASINTSHLQCKIVLQEENVSAPNTDIVTKAPLCTTGTGAWPGKGGKQCSANILVEKIEQESLEDLRSRQEEVTTALGVSNIEHTQTMTGESIKQMNSMHSMGYTSVLSKWCEVHKESTGSETVDLPAPSSCKINVNESVESIADTESKSQICMEGSLDEKQQLNKICKDGSRGSKIPDASTLRRSPRIRRAKKLPSEEECVDVDDGVSPKRRRGVRGETSLALWECGSCDAMFRTKASRDRHLEEGHAFTCYVCGWRGNSKTKYEGHISTVHCHHQARCLTCRKDFENYESYRQHMEATHPATTTTATATSIRTEAVIEAKVEDKQGEQTPEEGVDRKDKERHGNKSDPPDQDVKEIKVWVGMVEAGGSVESGSYQGYRAEQGCPYCSKTFHRRSRFLRHLNYHLGNRSFVCNVCSKSFVEKSGLDAHLLTHHPLNEPCDKCGKIFKTPRTKKRHMRTHQGRSFPCQVCSKVFRHEESLRVHKAVHIQGGSGYRCKVCEKDCKTPYYLQLHLSTKHEAAKFTCLTCQRSFKWKQSYRKHIAIYHGDAQLKYKCGLCTRHFLTTSELRLHQVAHSSERKHLCDICGKAFKHEYTRDKHVKTVHRDDREHMCPQCGSLFKAKAYLDQHLAHVHTTKERVKCKHCGHDFKTEANLRSHIKMVHKARSRKYPCQSCNKTFMAPKDLARHSKVHTGVKDFTCPTCQRGFSRKDNMLAHLRTHTADQPSLTYHLKPDPTQSHTPSPEGVTQILGLPSSLSSDVPPSTTIILPTMPHSGSNSIHTSAPSAAKVIHTAPSSSSNIIHCVPSSVNNIIQTTPSAVASSVHSASSSAVNIIHNIPSTASNIIQTVPCSANNIIHSNTSTASNKIHTTPSTNCNTIHSSPSSVTTPSSVSNILHTAPSSANSLIISSMPPESISLAGVPLSSNNTSFPNVPTSVGNLNNLSASSSGIILSTVHISSHGMTGAPVSSGTQLSFSTPQSSSSSAPVSYTHPSQHTLPHGSTSSSDTLVTSTSPTSSQNMVINIGRTPQQTYSLHPHLIPSSLPTASTSSLAPAVISLPSHPASSSPMLMPETNGTQMVCSSFQPDHVVLTAGVLSTASTTPVDQTHTSPHYTQLDPQGATLVSSSSLSSLPPCTTLDSGMAPAPLPATLPPKESHHSNSEGVVATETTQTGIILPTSSLLQDTALIIPEKSGVYTLVSEGGKITPLEALSVNPVPACHPAGQPPPIPLHTGHIHPDCPE